MKEQNQKELAVKQPDIVCCLERLQLGRAVAQAVSRWLPTAAARAPWGFVVDKAALRQVFSEYFGFPCQSFHQSL
jgi:hypothetical protein